MAGYPQSHLDLLQAPSVAVLSTKSPDGSIQSTCVWYLLDDGRLKISLNSSRRKLKNLQADPTVTVLILDLRNPQRYIEIRGRAQVAPDEDRSFAGKVGAAYRADLAAYDQPGTSRFTVTIEPHRVRAVDMSAG
jgi:PPOX class probable F420-dependent enzyme